MTESGRAAEAARGTDGALVPRGLVILMGCASVVVVVAGIRAVAWLLAPVLLALLVVIVISPVHRWLRGRGVPPWAATALTVVSVYGVIVSFGLLVVASVVRLGVLLPSYADRGREILVRGAAAGDELLGEPGRLRAIAESVDPVRILSSLGSLLAELTGLTTNLVFLLALLLFLGAETGGAEARLAEIAADRPRLGDALRDFARRTRRYLFVTTVFGLLVAAVDTLALAWLGIPFALLWGLLSFATNYIPNIGFLLGLVPPALLALLESGVRQALVVCAVYVVVNFVAQSLVQPRFAGDAVGLSATTAFVALVFWGWVLGPLGMLLAVPVTLLAMAVLVDVDPRAGWAAALMRTRSRRSASPRDDGGSPRAGEEGTRRIRHRGSRNRQSLQRKEAT